MKTMFAKIYLLLMFAILLVTVGCGNNNEIESKSMEQLQTENGTPVKLEVVKTQPFEKKLNFFGKFSGIKESINGALIGGRVEKINVKVGDYVKKGDIIAEWPTDAPGGMYEQAKSAFEMSQKNYDRMRTLLEAGETSQASFDGIETQYRVDKRNYELQQQLHKIEAPFDGVITNFAVEEGDNVDSKKPVFTIAQLHKLVTKVWANEEEIRYIRKGMKATTEFRGKIFSGYVTDVAITPDPATQSFYVELEFANPNRELITGITMDIEIIIYKSDEAILILRNLVKKDGGGEYVFVAQNDKAEKRYIKNGIGSGLYYQVTNGLQVGDKLIVKGSANLENASKINVIE